MALLPRRRLAFLPESLRRVPHLPAFWPEHQPVMEGAEILALPAGRPPRGAPAELLRYAAGPLRAPTFGRRMAPVALLLVDGLPTCLDSAPLAAAPPAAELAGRAAA
ncbi:hypothetical protein, partial [Pseudoroseomonas ludipueritiae]